MKLLITEKQYNKLFEARMEGFRLDYLLSCGSFKKRLDYCRQMLGRPIGNGSSRTVFQMDDETVLKLAKNNIGLKQNLREIELGNEPYLSCFPKVFNGTDENNGLWIVSEFVLPLLKKGKEFEDVLNIPFKDIQNFIVFSIMCGRKGYNKYAEEKKKLMYDKYEDNEDVVDLFNTLYELYYSYNQNIRDLQDYHNWGLVMRNGKPTFVILDSGLSEEVNKLYMNKFT